MESSKLHWAERGFIYLSDTYLELYVTGIALVLYEF